MRIEAQGHVEVQPTFAHVGYISAMADGVYFETRVTPSAITAGLCLLSLVCALAASRKSAKRLQWTLGLLAAGAVVIPGCAYLRGRPELTLAPDYHRSLVCLERAVEFTDGWIEELGRAPAPEEWSARVASEDWAVDPWGGQLRYELLDEPSRDDGRAYVVTAGRQTGRPEVDRATWGIPSSDLGRDGVFGTPDDRGRLERQRKWGDWTEPGRYVHGVAAAGI